MAVIFLGPQLYKSYHIFADHHGHLNCEAMHSNDNGLNGENDHCPICAYQFAYFDKPEVFEPNFAFFSFPQFSVETIEIFHSTQPVNSNLLRGPPLNNDFIG